MTVALRRSYQFSHAFVQAGIKYYVWRLRGPVVLLGGNWSDGLDEVVYKADYFWGLV